MSEKFVLCQSQFPFQSYWSNSRICLLVISREELTDWWWWWSWSCTVLAKHSYSPTPSKMDVSNVRSRFWHSPRYRQLIIFLFNSVFWAAVSIHRLQSCWQIKIDLSSLQINLDIEVLTSGLQGDRYAAPDLVVFFNFVVVLRRDLHSKFIWNIKLFQ